MKSLVPLTLFIVLAGCAGTSATPNYDMRFGDAVREARQRMTLNPAAASTDPVAGMDGRAAHEAQERYQDSYKTPPPVVNVINIGGSGGRGGQ
ncbi:MAG TPA: hypothetical protein VMZ74_06895 [Ramlibacter sp.]|nr:hypothetical protein [Ramlibacter sp.]